MKRIYIKAFNQLKKLGCPVFERSDVEGFIISAEHPESWQWADMYTSRNDWGGEETSPVLEKILHDNRLFCEWENAGCLIVHPA